MTTQRRIIEALVLLACAIAFAFGYWQGRTDERIADEQRCNAVMEQADRDGMTAREYHDSQ